LKLSVIIPLSPGEAAPEELLEALVSRPGVSELLLAPTQTLDLPASIHLPQFPGPAGRGCQQNRAADNAVGEWLWFIHSDSRLPTKALDQALAFVESSRSAIGYAWLRFAGDGPFLTRLNAFGANLRSRWPGWPYGDQGLCLPKASFEALGGFREDLERGEDLDLVVRARRIGILAVPMGMTITTSARRYGEQGWLKTSLAHQIAAWRLYRQAR
jgi:hypothetical protein